MRIITRRGGRAVSRSSEFKAVGSTCCHNGFRTALIECPGFQRLFLMAALLINLGTTTQAQSALTWEVPVGYFFVNTPATGDLDGDGRLEIVITSNGINQQPVAVASTGMATAVASDGTPLPGWPVMTNEQVGPLPPTPPEVADLDGDGQAEVIFGHGHSLYVFRGNGQLLWQQRVGGFFNKKPLVCDLDGDGQPEILNSADQFLGQAKIYIWRWDGRPYPGSPILLDEFFASSPAVYQEAGRTLLAVGGGNGFNWPGGSLYLFAREQGRLRLQRQWEIGQHPISKPIFADLDGDGSIDIVGGTYTPSVYAVRTSDGWFVQGWPQPVGGSVFTSPAVLHYQDQTLIFAVALDGTLHAWNHQGQSLWTVEVIPNAIDNITLADLNADGRPEVILGVNGGVMAVSMEGHILNRWEVGDYWVTGTLMAELEAQGTVSLLFGGVDNVTEEAKLFILRP